MSSESSNYEPNPLLERFLQDYATAEVPYMDLDNQNPELYDFTKMLAITDTVLNPEENILQDNGRISLAYEKLFNVPQQIAEKFADRTQILDLSYNNITDLSFLSNFKQLHTLILDQNETPNENSLPYLPKLQILWLNNCQIKNVTKWIYQLQSKCPNLKHLSLMGNPGACTILNGATVLDHNEYRLFIKCILSSLVFLDDCTITDNEREAAETNKNKFMQTGPPLGLRNKIGSNSIPNFFRFERKNSIRSQSSSTDSQ